MVLNILTFFGNLPTYLGLKWILHCKIPRFHAIISAVGQGEEDHHHPIFSLNVKELLRRWSSLAFEAAVDLGCQGTLGKGWILRFVLLTDGVEVGFKFLNIGEDTDARLFDSILFILVHMEEKLAPYY